MMKTNWIRSTWAGLAVMSCLMMASCGGSGAGSLGSNGVSIAFDADLLPSTGAEIMQGASGQPVASGSAVVSVETAPSTLPIFDQATDTYLGSIFVDPAHPSLQVTQDQMAASLLYIALGGAQLPADARATSFAQVLADPATRILGQALKTALSADKFALAHQDPALVAAVKNAIATVAVRFTPPEEGTSAQRTAAQAASTRDSGSSDYILNTDNTGLGFTQDQAQQVFIHGNYGTYKETTCYSFLVRTATEEQHQRGESTDVDPIVPLLSGITSERIQTIGTGSSKDVVVTPKLPYDASHNSEEIVLIGLTGHFDRPDPEIFSDPRYAAYVPLFRTELGELRRRAVLGIAYETMYELIGIRSGKPSTAYLHEVTPKFAADARFIPALDKAALGKNLPDCIYTFLQAVVADQISAVTALGYMGGIDGLSSDEVATRVYRRLASEMSTFYFFNVLDPQTLKGWEAEALMRARETSTMVYVGRGFVDKSVIRLSAKPAAYEPSGSEIKIEADSAETPGIVYQWSASGDSNILFTDGTHTGASFTGSSGRVTLTTSPSTSAAAIVVTCTATIPQTSGPETKLGTSTITIARNELASIEVIPGGAFNVTVHDTVQLKAYGKNVGGITYPLPDGSVTWESDDPRATVSATGLVTAEKVGFANITARLTGTRKFKEVNLTIVPINVETEIVYEDWSAKDLNPSASSTEPRSVGWFWRFQTKPGDKFYYFNVVEKTDVPRVEDLTISTSNFGQVTPDDVPLWVRGFHVPFTTTTIGIQRHSAPYRRGDYVYIDFHEGTPVTYGTGGDYPSKAAAIAALDANRANHKIDFVVGKE